MILFSNTKHVIDIILNNNIITYIKVEYPKSLGFDGFRIPKKLRKYTPSARHAFRINPTYASIILSKRIIDTEWSNDNLKVAT